jgi:type I restriction enzyme S subunit
VSLELRPYPEYKGSGAPWLGQVPSHWRLLRTKYLFCEVDERSIDGLETHLSMSQRRGLIAASESSEQRLLSESYAGAKKCRQNDLVLNRLKAHLGVFAHASQDGLVSPDYTVFRCKGLNRVKFFEYQFKTPAYVGELRRSTKGIVEGFWRLYTDDFFRIVAAVPPTHEQDKILRWVERFDGRIKRLVAAKRRVIELLNEQKQAVINDAVFREMASEPGIVGPDCGWPTEISSRFTRTKLSRICASIRDGTHNPPPATKGLHRLLSVRNIVGRGFVTRPDDRTMTEAAFAELQRSYSVECGDVVIALVGATTGKSAVVGDMENVTVQRSIGILRPRASHVTSEFLNLVIASEFVQRQIRLVMLKYAAQPGIYLEELGRLQVVLPPIGKQKEIVRQVEQSTASLDSSLAQFENELSLIREYRTRLIADVVTGKLDVRGVELLDLSDVEGVGEVEDEELEDPEELVAVEENADAD